ncbi:DNA-protecting protein DprA [Nocardiopsis gilva YIM 90087]|uniref:DNA-protecting protein DprA n=3 Tax=Nocardiopsis gilva TaxID=280236 RepID=A0A223S4E1_9ACTN|nr:DNA-protecting protein DprA [Nocardiopsis gilva YIM 90087]
MGALIGEHGAAEIWAALRAGTKLPDVEGTDTQQRSTRTARQERWRARAQGIDPDALLSASAEMGGRLVVPGDPEWPGRLDRLGQRRPYALWLRGVQDLRNACLRSVAMVGSRAATGYGLHVAADLACGLAERSWSVVSGGAYGIDGAAHRGALAGGAPTVAVLACGLDIDYPRGHEALFVDIAARGTLVSEHPRGTVPTRHGFLVRNRIIAALTPGTVVVEAGLRSGALNTARHAQDLCSVLMAVPGPVTSALSAGCHRLLREWQAACVTDAADVAEQLGPIGEELRPGGGTALARDGLDEESRRVLDAVPDRRGTGTATIALAADLDLDAALGRLGLLAAGGFIERCAEGWRTRPDSGMQER